MLPQGRIQHILIKPWIRAPGTHYFWGVRCSVACEALGIEPQTSWSLVLCHTNWATSSYRISCLYQGLPEMNITLLFITHPNSQILVWIWLWRSYMIVFFELNTFSPYPCYQRIRQCSANTKCCSLHINVIFVQSLSQATLHSYRGVIMSSSSPAPDVTRS